MGMGLKEKGMFRHFAILAVALAAPCWAAEQMYSVVLAGSGSTGINAMAVDSQGNAYIAGGTSSPDFPVTPGAYQTQLGGGTFVAKLDPAGKIIWATFLGGKPGAYLNGVAFDPSGNVYVAGNTLSPNFPAASVFPSRIPVNFVAKLSADGSSFIYASLFETGQGGGIAGLAVDPHGNAYVAGSARSDSLAATPSAFQTQSTGLEGYAAKLKQDGSGWDYVTYLGGSGQDTATSIAVNSNGEAYVAGMTTSPNFPGAVRGALKTLNNISDAFVAKLTASGSGIYWSSYLGIKGAPGFTQFPGIALDPSGGVYVASAGWDSAPTVCKLSPDGSAFVYSTVVITSTSEQMSLAVNSAGEAYVGATTTSYGGLLVTPGALEGAKYGGQQTGYVQKIDATGANVLYGSYFSAGSNLASSFGGIGVDAADHLYLAGSTIAASENNGWGNVVKVDLTQTQPVWLGAVVNSASLFAWFLAPGELITLFGSGLGPATPVTARPVNGEMPTQLGDVEVLVNSVPAPLLYVSSSQINAIVPFAVPATAQVAVQFQGESSNAVSIPVSSNSIGIFTADGSGSGQAAASNQDGTPNSPSNPAPRGSIVSIWLTGAGQTNPPLADGEITPASSLATLPGGLLVGLSGADWVGVEGPVTYAGVAPELVAGIAQVNFTIPTNVQPGPAVLVFFGWLSPWPALQSVTMAVE